jgi:hypothetical protein
MSWFLKAETRPETGRDQVWAYTCQHDWDLMHLTGEKTMIFDTKAEAIFALQQVHPDEEDEFEYSVEAV